jgi:glycolate oxidase FAD binding subunit
MAEASEALRRTHREQMRVTFVGGGTQMSLGAPPEALDAVIHTDGLSQLVEYAPSDLVITVEAGMTLSQLQAAVAQHHQRLALDPPRPELATLGGIIATNAFGPRRTQFGSVRDLLIGITLILADGTVARGGGKVVKNVAGFDLPKVLCGSLGTLAMIATATFRLHPLPEASATVLIAARTGPQTWEIVKAIKAAQLEPSSIAAVRTGALWNVGVRFEGFGAGVAQQTARLREIAAKIGFTADPLEDTQANGFWAEQEGSWIDGQVRLKIASLPNEIQKPDLLDPVLTLLHGASSTWYPTLGIAIVSGAPAEAESLSRAVLNLRSKLVAGGGSLVLIDAPADMRREIDVWGPKPPSFALMARLKDRFDPERRLNPGRFVGGL